jgi:Asp-tRNA(Asn)/Glu-tRNA(Gln) amidotransferase A subunit family amidase
MAALGRATTALDLIAADNLFMTAAIEMARFQQRYPVVLTPTLARPPARLGELSLSQDPGAYGAAFGAYCPFTALANQTGQPAMNVPLHWNAEGLPIGLHFLGRLGDEPLLLALAAQLERAAPWMDRRPEL